MKTFTFTLTVAESKRLIARALSKSPLMADALKNHYVIVANGTTNAYICEELTQEEITNKSYNTAGITTKGVACVTDSDTRLPHLVLYKGKSCNLNYTDALQKFTSKDIFIKGANCFDNEGNVGLLLGGDGAGTIGKAYGTLRTAGSKLIVAVSHEKLIPSVREAASNMGRDAIDYSIGMKCGLFVISDAILFTELTAIETLFSLKATIVAAGGIGDCRGSVTLLVSGEDNKVKECYQYIKSIKGEPEVNGSKRGCNTCINQCELIVSVDNKKNLK